MDISCGLDLIYISAEAVVVGVAKAVEELSPVIIALTVVGEFPRLLRQVFKFRR